MNVIYDVISMTQCTGFLAAFTEKNEDGVFSIFTEPVDFMGVVITSEIDRHGTVMRSYHEVHPMHLDSGCIWVTTELENFLGMFREGDDPEKVFEAELAVRNRRPE